MDESKPSCPIAVIGLGCWYPDAHNPVQFWENILSRRRSFRRMPDRRTPLKDYYHDDPKKPDKTYLKRAALIDGFKFDWKKRRIPFSTYQSTDTVHWLALEIAMAALSDAGYGPASIPGQRTGVIVGNTLTGEQTRANGLRLRWPLIQRALHTAARTNGVEKDMIAKFEGSFEQYFKSISPLVDEDSLAGGLSNTIAGRICNYLNLDGGGYTVDGACSSSLLAISTAATGLMNMDLNLALAGGVDISLDPFEIIGFAKAGALTPDDMRVYDRRGNGFLPGEGCGFVVLKRLEDARRDDDDIYAILHGWGISSDGRGTSITAPNPKGQSRAVQRAYERAPFNPDELDFIEGHGTGTAVGDQVELEGIARAMKRFMKSKEDTKRFCGMTSLKSIIGHTKAAAGVGAFIKAVMAVNRRVLPPTAGCRDPHPVFTTEADALYPILTGKKPAPGKTLRAGVSAMGFGGINCHVCIESADPPIPKLTPSFKEQTLIASHQETELFIFSAESPTELISYVDGLSEEVRDISIADLADLAADLAEKTEHDRSFRAAIIAGHPDQLLERLGRLTAVLRNTPPAPGERYQDIKNQIWVGNRMTTPRIGFLFPGQGAQQLNMAKRLIDRYDWASGMLTRADTLLAQDGLTSASSVIYRDLDSALGSNRLKEWANVLTQTEYAQPAVCLNSMLWLNWLKGMGVQPTAVGGHSLGELTAFHASGAFDADTLIRFSGLRGKIFAEQAKKDGAMVSLRCAKEKAENLLSQVDGYAILSNINSPRQMVVAGEQSAMNQILRIATEAGIPAYRLSVSGAFHTRLVADAAKKIEKETLLPTRLEKSACRLFSGVTGEEVPAGEYLKKYFAKQVLSPVKFTSLVTSMGKSCDLFIEVGPGRALTGMVNDIYKDAGPLCLPVESTPGRDRDTNQLLATLFVHKTKINWDKVYDPRLIRPFIRPSERLFFENPCERPFDTTASPDPSLTIPYHESFETLFAGLGNISRDKIDNYLKTRGAFLARVIQADMDYTVSDAQWLPAAETDSSGKAKIPDKTETETDIIDTDREIDAILFDTLESITGFSRDTLTPDMRLLDDLNLDSIKTGDLLTRVAKAAGILGEIAPLDFSNVTLEEIIQGLSQAKTRNAEPVKTEKPDILTTIMDHVSKLIGNRPDEINADALLKKDLNIDKNQLKEMLPGLSHRIKIDIHVDLDPLLKRTLRQIASILERISEKQQARPLSASSYESHRPPWVREFHLSMNRQPLKKTKKSKRREDKWQYAHALVLCDDQENEVAMAVEKKLLGLGARVDVRTHADALDKNLSDRSDYSHFFNILPNKEKNTQTAYNATSLREIITRLASAATVAPASLAPRRRNTVAYLQFGGGYFGTHPEAAFLDQCAAMALAASIHQERSDLRVRVLDFSPSLSADTVAKKTIEEIAASGPFTAVGYDQDLVRRERYQDLMDPETYKPRSYTWSKKDVILVTGGAKGITAECALGVARASGARMALVGRSALPDLQIEQTTTDEITTTLNKYTDRDLTARYYSCDISDRNAVNALVEQVKKEMGPITGVIHGAGLNNPKATTQVSIDEAIREVSPKVLGALNILAALEQMPPKLFLGLTSIIGVTGMPGNAWYGFSNEALDIILQRFEVDHPDTRTLSVAYSIWQDKGMGARMGSVNILGKQGISAIPTEEGVDRFVRLFFNNPGVHQVIVAARLSGLDTWKFEPQPITENARFLEKPLHVTPGVESAFHVHLSLKKDPYLKDHQFEGTHLFPAVFGLEAMAQAVTHVTGIQDLSRVRIENIELSRPVTVDPGAGTDILVWAEVELQITDSAMTIVRTGIYQPGISAESDSFSATFILGLNKKPPKHHIRLPKNPLEINPGTDLYRETWLFQGPRFQRIKSVWVLESANDGGKSILTIQKKRPQVMLTDAFPDSRHHIMATGDAFFRDTLLQSAAVLIPQDTSLPVYIDRLDIFPQKTPRTEAETQNLTTVVEILRKDEKDAKALVISVDSNGNIVERLEGYHLRILSHHDDYPTVSDLVNPDSRDSRLVQNALDHWARKFNIQVPQARIAYLPGLYTLPKKARHRLELPLITKAVRQALDTIPNPPEEFNIQWPKMDCPIVKTREKLDIEVALSHDNRLCLATAGSEPQRCAIARITSRSRGKWDKFIGEQHSSLLDSLIDGGDSLDKAGTRILKSIEVIRGLNSKSPENLEATKLIGNMILFKDKKENATVLTVPLRFTRGKDRMLAISIGNHTINSQDITATDVSYNDLLRYPSYQVKREGPQGQDIFIYRMPLCFKPSAQLSRTAYFSFYLFWAGEVRETSAWPVLGDIAKDFATGRWGGVTNYTHLHIVGEPTTSDKIEIWMWASGNSGPFNAITELTYDFRKMLPNGKFERVAWLEQKSTWVEILDHGIVKPAPFPDYYSNFMKEMFPRYEAPNTLELLPEPIAHLQLNKLESAEYLSPKGPSIRPMLHEQAFDTSLTDANIVGNIYFAHYYTWLGHTRDRYFFQLIPEYYRGIGEKGELLCTECQVNHLREAMPFDRIVVTMALKKLTRAHVVLYFEFFRQEPDGKRTKLAYGEQTNVWAKRDANGKPEATPFPNAVKDGFHRAISDLT